MQNIWFRKKSNKWHKVILTLSLSVGLLAVSNNGLADTSSSTNIFTSFLQALSQVIGQALSSSSSSSVSSLANLINTLTNSKSTDAGLNIQSSYISLGSDSSGGEEMEQNAQENAQTVGQVLAQQFSGFANPFKAQLAAYKNLAGQKTVCSSVQDPNGNKYNICAPKEYCESSSGPCYSPTSSNTLFQNDVYDSTQQAAAYAYLQNASGALMGIRKPDAKWQQTSAVVKYNAYYQTIAALQSMSANSLAYTYALRVPQSNGNNSSLQQQYQSILEGSATSSKYWSEINSLPVIGQLAIIVYQLPALMIGISRLTDLLEQINGSLAALNISNGILSQMTFGEQMYSDAQSSQSANAKTKTYTAPDKNNQNSNPSSVNSSSVSS